MEGYKEVVGEESVHKVVDKIGEIRSRGRYVER
jgi:tRNA A-37 threonylcarbamoyl transferase component Bud32